jgi:hypothetical protein
VRVNEKKDRVEAVGSTVLPPNALRDAIKAHNFFRGTWRFVCVCVLRKRERVSVSVCVFECVF